MSTKDNKKSHAQRERGGTVLTNPATRGPFMENRVNLGKAAPELYQSIVNLDRLASELAASAGIAEGLTHLLRLRASQLNQCAYCVRLHTRDALASGNQVIALAFCPHGGKRTTSMTKSVPPLRLLKL
jgi:AhpD family alkylhydroperoxidase